MTIRQIAAGPLCVQLTKDDSYLRNYTAIPKSAKFASAAASVEVDLLQTSASSRTCSSPGEFMRDTSIPSTDRSTPSGRP